MARTIIHVNRQLLAMNAKDGGTRPSYIVREGDKVTYCHQIDVYGHLRFIDPRDHPQLKCGARAWAELVDGTITMKDPQTFVEAKGQHCALAFVSANDHASANANSA